MSEILFAWVLNSTAAASILALLVLLLKYLLKDKVNARWHYYIWFLLIIRLLMPDAPASPLSLSNLLPPVGYRTVGLAEQPGPAAGVITVQPEQGGAVRPIQPTEILPASAAPAVQKSQLSLSLYWIWLSMATLLGGYSIAASSLYHVRLKRAGICRDEEINAVLIACKAEMGITAYIPVYQSEMIQGPALFGWLRPCLLLPKNIKSRLSLPQLRYVILHELVHLKRQDVAVGCIAGVLQVLHWFNPLIWLAFFRMRQDCEVACDAAVLSRIEITERSKYGLTLLSVLEGLSRPLPLPALAGIAESKSLIKRRIAMISLFRERAYRWSVLAILLLMAVGCAGLTDPLAKEERQTAATALYTVKVPSDWTVETLPGAALAFAAGDGIIASIDVLGYYPDDPVSQLLANHAEVLSSGPVEGLAESAWWYRLHHSEPAASGSEQTVERYHIYYLIPDRQLALDFSFAPAQVNEKTAADIVKTVVFAGDSIGTVVEEKLAKIVDNKTVAGMSNPYGYIAASQTEFDAIVALGEKSLQYMVGQLREAQEDGLREYVMAAACAAILGETEQGWSTGREWYNKYSSGSALEGDAVSRIITAIGTADSVTLTQTDESELQCTLTTGQLDTLRSGLSDLRPYDMPSPHGSGYPGYQITAYRDGQVVVSFAIQDPVYVMLTPDLEYFAGAQKLWQFVIEALPPKAGKAGTVEQLFQAQRVEITANQGEYSLEYDLTREPSLAFRIASLVRILQTAEMETGTEPADPSELYFTITFDTGSGPAVLKVYQDAAYCAGLVFRLPDIGQLMGSNINAG